MTPSVAEIPALGDRLATDPAGDLLPPASAAPKRPRLLIVDDDDAVREALRHVFDRDYELMVASSGGEALSLLRRGEIDVVISDLRLPGMSGLEFLAQLRVVDPDVPCLILTGFGSVDSASEAIRLGVFAYLAKPFSVASLRQTVADAQRRYDDLRLQRRQLDQLRNVASQVEDARLERNMYAGVLHDLNGPLTFIAGMSELVRDEMAAEPSPARMGDWRRHCEDIRRQATYCGELAQRTVRYVRQAGAEETCDIARVLEDFRLVLRAHPAARGHMINLRATPSAIRGRIRGADLLRVLVNLGVNGLQSTSEPHRLEIESWVLNQSVDLEALNARAPGLFVGRDTFANRAPLVAIAVKDNGPGIRPEILPHLFHSVVTTKSEGEGTGLGLTIVRRTMLENSAALHLRTQPGRGTCITLFVPAVAG
jgi:signal transduction histidine kinase